METLVSSWVRVLSERVDYIRDNYCPRGFKDVPPAYLFLDGYIREVADDVELELPDEDQLDEIYSSLKEKYGEFEASHDRSALYMVIRESYFYSQEEVAESSKYELKTPMMQLILDNKEYLDCDAYDGWKKDFVSTITKILYRLINDGDPGVSIEEPCIMIGINTVDALRNELTTNEEIILRAFLEYVYEGFKKSDNHWKILAENVKSTEFKPVLDDYYKDQMEDYMKIFTGRIDEVKLDIEDIGRQIQQDYLTSDLKYLLVALNLIWKVYPDFGKRLGIKPSMKYVYER